MAAKTVSIWNLDTNAMSKAPLGVLLLTKRGNPEWIGALSKLSRGASEASFTAPNGEMVSLQMVAA